MNERYLEVLNKLRPIDDTFMRMISGIINVLNC